MIGAVLFDIDGTLIDSNDLHAAAWREAFLHFGIDLPHDVIRSQIGKGGDHLVPTLLSPALVEQRQDEIEAYRSELFKRDYLPQVVPFPGVRDLFERLRADGKRIVLASSAKADEVDVYVGLIDVGDLIEAMISGDDVAHSKPDPDIFAAALARVAPLTADEVMVVGDTPYDIEAAAKLGIRTLAVRCGGFPEEQLQSAAEIYDGPADLLARYDRSLLAR